MRFHSRPFRRYAISSCVLASCLVMPGAWRRVLAQQQPVAGYDRDRWATALDVARKDILNNYYDPAFHGIDVEAHFTRAREKRDQAPSASSHSTSTARAGRSCCIRTRRPVSW